MAAKSFCLVIVAAALLIGCGAAPTRSQDPGRYELVASGTVSPASTLALQECLIDVFTELNSGNTALSVVQTRRSQGSRIEVYVSRVNLAVSADVFDDGRTELRLAPDPFRMFSKEPTAYRACVSKVTAKPSAINSDSATVKTMDVLDGPHAVRVLGRVVWVWNGKKI